MLFVFLSEVFIISKNRLKMNYKTLGKTGFEVSEISLGTWQLGGKWGSKFDPANAERILKTAVDDGVNFIDTADVYSDGESEKAIGRFLKSTKERIYVATKCGRRLSPHTNEVYTTEALRGFVEDSLSNLQVDAIDLIQLHCPPTEVYYRPEIFELFEKLKKEGKILNMGVSVEKVEEAIKAIEYPNVTTVQIIYNIFRQRPVELFFELAWQKDVGIIIRVPLASGLLTGLYTTKTKFEEGDHRNFNREGKFFDKGETFSGIDYKTGIKAMEKLKAIFNFPDNLAPYALKWILMNRYISCIIPGASKEEQVRSNVSASDLPDITEYQLYNIGEVYSEMIKPLIHQNW
jgi:aryl-alcohol dehydrogenase-like predicted oxidoreductase